jgi:hypothetical protein
MGNKAQKAPPTSDTTSQARPLYSCSECDKTSTLHTVSLEKSSTQLFCTPFQDDATGRVHNHDSNSGNLHCRCSNGHEWVVSAIPNTCWCGWSAGCEVELPGKDKEEST